MCVANQWTVELLPEWAEGDAAWLYAVTAATAEDAEVRAVAEIRSDGEEGAIQMVRVWAGLPVDRDSLNDRRGARLDSLTVPGVIGQ